jgi:hypothetical protein
MSKMWDDRILPAAEVYFVNDKDEIEITDFYDKHRSGPGIQAFLEEVGVLDVELDPPKILDRIGTRYLQIL